MNKHYEGWNTPQHLAHFDFWNSQSDGLFRFAYGAFQEVRYLLEALRETPSASVLDVGCATGTTYRKLQLERALGDYTGVDLSEPAIARARRLHPNGNFIAKKHEPLAHFFKRRFDVVFSRDTVMHQTDPMSFIDDLASVTSRALIVRLRTRDAGPTAYDVEQSCQMHYDQHWMPYIVINFDELITKLRSLPGCARITVNRSYEVLGGNAFRYLPKDLYYQSAGGAETSVRVDFEETSDSPATLTETTELEGRQFLAAHRWHHRLLMAADRLNLNRAGRS